jgi:hypothetical protein
MGRRIVRSEMIREVRKTRGAGAPPDLGQYWDRLKNLIPAEVSAIYIAGLGVIPTEEQVGLSIWATACLVFTGIFIAKESRTEEGNPDKVYPIDWIHVAISCASFAIWTYALGGPFANLGIYVPWVGTLLMLGWTFLVPYIYRGSDQV